MIFNSSSQRCSSTCFFQLSQREAAWLYEALKVEIFYIMQLWYLIKALIGTLDVETSLDIEKS